MMSNLHDLFCLTKITSTKTHMVICVNMHGTYILHNNIYGRIHIYFIMFINDFILQKTLLLSC